MSTERRSIYTLEHDLKELLTSKNWFTEDIASEFSGEIETRLASQFNRGATAPTLRLSQLRDQCPCALWHSINKPELAEPFPAWTENKFSFGHIVEGLTIAQCKAAGHSVVGEQDELVLDGIKGHRDCVIDGFTVDVKSCSSPSFKKIKAGGLAQDDLFGYLDQLDGYMLASNSDPLVQIKDRSFILAVDKQLGHVTLYEHKLTPARATILKDRIRRYKSIVSKLEPPTCECEVQNEGNNKKLGVKASYSNFKWCCFPKLRAFLYAGGPAFLTQVNYLPSVPEIDKYGRII
jgi:hypothetical protein